ncbi:MAG: hypothetical protein PF694_15085 [Bacteroidetes bacterium]|jgi:hypothetical protein|nr:hypothetical protein [Bacteroidota bacterium]
MIVIADSRIPNAAKKPLATLAEPLWLKPQPMVYPSIAAHPDLFFCPTKSGLVVAPELLKQWTKTLTKNGVKHIQGSVNLAAKYPQTAIYNAVATASLLIHNLRYTAPEILNQYPVEQQIKVAQAYARCNLIALDEDHFITSDQGIRAALQQLNKTVLYIDPKQIKLAGHPYGFFGGCCGILGKQLVICGDPEFLKENASLCAFTAKSGFTIKPLFYGPPADVGSLLFL